MDCRPPSHSLNKAWCPYEGHHEKNFPFLDIVRRGLGGLFINVRDAIYGRKITSTAKFNRVFGIWLLKTIIIIILTISIVILYLCLHMHKTTILS